MENVNNSGLTVDEKSVLEALLYKKPFLNDYINNNSLNDALLRACIHSPGMFIENLLIFLS